MLSSHHNNWVTMSVPTGDSYRIPKGVNYGFPII
jgi:malate dehydrogenase